MTKKIESKIIFKNGEKLDLPTELEAGEFGFAIDDGSLVIGSDGRYGQPQHARTEYPYKNIEVLTELTDQTFAKMHGDRMREGINYDYYYSELDADKLAWSDVRVEIEGEYFPYIISVDDGVTLFIDYAVTDGTSGTPIRDGQLIVWYDDAMNAPTFTDRSSQPRDKYLTAPANYDARDVFNQIKFRFLLSQDHSEIRMQYKNYLFENATLQFKVSRPIASIIDVAPKPLAFKVAGFHQAPPPPDVEIEDGDEWDFQFKWSADGVTFMAYGISSDEDGNIYLAGGYSDEEYAYYATVYHFLGKDYEDDPYFGNGSLLKINPQGQLIWQRNINGDFDTIHTDMTSVATFKNETNLTEVWACASTQPQVAPAINTTILYYYTKNIHGNITGYDENGDALLNSNYVHSTNERDIIFTTIKVIENDLIVAGTLSATLIEPQSGGYSASGTNDPFVARISRDTGEVIWSSTYQRVEDDPYFQSAASTDIAIDDNGNVYMGLMYYDSRYSVVKYNSAGAMLWARSISIPYIQVVKLGVNPDGSITVVSKSSNDLGYTALDPVHIVKFSSNGQFLTSKTILYGDTGSENDSLVLASNSTHIFMAVHKFAEGTTFNQTCHSTIIYKMDLDYTIVSQSIVDLADISNYSEYLLKLDAKDDFIYLSLSQTEGSLDQRTAAVAVVKLDTDLNGTTNFSDNIRVYDAANTGFYIDSFGAGSITENDVTNPAHTVATGILVPESSTVDIKTVETIDDGILIPTVYPINDIQVITNDYWVANSVETDTAHINTVNFSPLILPYHDVIPNPDDSKIDSAGNVYTLVRLWGTHSRVQNITSTSTDDTPLNYYRAYFAIEKRNSTGDLIWSKRYGVARAYFPDTEFYLYFDTDDVIDGMQFTVDTSGIYITFASNFVKTVVDTNIGIHDGVPVIINPGSQIRYSAFAVMKISLAGSVVWARNLSVSNNADVPVGRLKINTDSNQVIVSLSRGAQSNTVNILSTYTFTKSTGDFITYQIKDIGDNRRDPIIAMTPDGEGGYLTIKPTMNDDSLAYFGWDFTNPAEFHLTKHGTNLAPVWATRVSVDAIDGILFSILNPASLVVNPTSGDIYVLGTVTHNPGQAGAETENSRPGPGVGHTYRFFMKFNSDGEFQHYKAYEYLLAENTEAYLLAQPMTDGSLLDCYYNTYPFTSDYKIGKVSAGISGSTIASMCYVMFPYGRGRIVDTFSTEGDAIRVVSLYRMYDFQGFIDLDPGCFALSEDAIYIHMKYIYGEAGLSIIKMPLIGDFKMPKNFFKNNVSALPVSIPFTTEHLDSGDIDYVRTPSSPYFTSGDIVVLDIVASMTIDGTSLVQTYKSPLGEP